ncbi:hypothetical protein [Cellulosilyticum ruminicola]|uniref:hypothetical protein n=1 Tax=Cellulosilyticum ruminicola TaxID=425254 RepID=UPI0006CFBC72|nr:hypothetical protein [Cellulosilyticum ruminicola]
MGRTVKMVSKSAVALLIIAIAASIYIMKNNLGAIPGLDFGCGQYYYTDVPNWQYIFSGRGYTPSGNILLYIALFFLWGILMYNVWVFLDKSLR